MSENIEYKTPVEQKIDEIQSSFQLFVDTQKFAGLILIASILISLLLINWSAVSPLYHKLVEISLGIHIDGTTHLFTLKEFVNDFLLLFFFLVLGLEIKREFVVGELADLSRAVIVILAAIGGICLPIVFYLSLNYASEYSHGWAIPTATDTAIAIGLMSLFKSRLPNGAFPFIAALAVLDDVVAISIIALFYTKGVQVEYLLGAVIVTLLMIGANISGIRHSLFYFLFGFGLWLLFELSGVHGAIVGVIIAFTIPARPKDKPHLFVNKIKVLIRLFEKKHDTTQHILESKEQHEILEEVREETLKASTPLRRWEVKLEKPVLLLILPLFALTNGAVEINFSILNDAVHTPLFWGIFLGLALGKPIGISLLSYLGLYLKVGSLPADMKRKHILPISLLAGVGYTMSIFISDLAFSSLEVINYAKLSIVMSSLFAATVASLIILRLKKI